MTYKEAKELLGLILDDVPLTKDEQEVFECVFNALEKQIAMGNDTHYGECAGLEQ